MVVVKVKNVQGRHSWGIRQFTTSIDPVWNLHSVWDLTESNYCFARCLLALSAKGGTESGDVLRRDDGKGDVGTCGGDGDGSGHEV